MRSNGLCWGQASSLQPIYPLLSSNSTPFPGSAPNEVAIKTCGVSLPGPDEVWCLKPGLAAMQSPWGGEITEQDNQQVQFSYALPIDNKSNIIPSSLSDLHQSIYTIDRPLNELICFISREISNVVYGALELGTVNLL